MSVVPKRFSYEWKKYPPSSKIGVGLPTTTKKTKEKSSMKLDTDSLAHSKWNCKYHIVFAPKYRRQVIYGKIKADIGITELCNFVPVNKGDVFFIPAGMVHAIGEGMLIAEVQQNSNITYRVSDYGRLGADGKPRALHKEKALNVISRVPKPLKSDVKETITASAKEKQLASCKYFDVKTIDLDGQKTLCEKDSFISVLILEGSLVIEYGDESMELVKADSLFVPAGLTLKLNGKAKVLVSRV